MEVDAVLEAAVFESNQGDAGWPSARDSGNPSVHLNPFSDGAETKGRGE